MFAAQARSGQLSPEVAQETLRQLTMNPPKNTTSEVEGHEERFEKNEAEGQVM